jgi:hypothetical protein
MESRIKALVMTYDRHRVFAEHMMAVYENLWPDNPFQFIIPYQQLAGAESESRRYKQSPQSIRETVLTLLDGIDDEEWIYWCWDDNYPVWLDVGRMSAMVPWIRSIQDHEVSGVLACRCFKFHGKRSLLDKKIYDSSGNGYLEIKGYRRIWSHQFLRAKVVRHIFSEILPDDFADVGTMGEMVRHGERPASYRRFVSEQNCMLLGESMISGVITRNCYESMVRYGLSMPEGFNGVIGREKIMGPEGRGERKTGGMSYALLKKAKNLWHKSVSK